MSTTTVKLTNRSRTAKTYNLTVATAPRRMVVARRVDDRHGNSRKEERRLMVPDSITLLAGESRIVPVGFLTSPEIKAAIEKRDLVRVDVPDETPKTPAAPETVEAPELEIKAPARARSRQSAD